MTRECSGNTLTELKPGLRFSREGTVGSWNTIFRSSSFGNLPTRSVLDAGSYLNPSKQALPEQTFIPTSLRRYPTTEHCIQQIQHPVHACSRLDRKMITATHSQSTVILVLSSWNSCTIRAICCRTLTSQSTSSSRIRAVATFSSTILIFPVSCKDIYRKYT